jgi:hypothetical protein
MADMARKGRHRPWVELQTHCKNGHPFDEANTQWATRNGYRVRRCRVCSREQQRGYYNTRRQHALDNRVW